MSDVKHRMIVLSCAVVAAVTALAALAFEGWVQIERFKPSYDIVVDLDAPRRIGCFAAYTNENYHGPAVACLSQDGHSELVLPNVPANVSTLLIGLGEEPDLEFTIRSIKFTTSKSYAAAPGFVIREYGPREFAAWLQVDVKVDAETGRTVATTRGPRLHASPKLDLAAATPRNPNEPSLLGRLPATLLIASFVGLVAFAVLLTIFARQYRSASSTERHNAALAAIGSVGFVLTVVTAFPGHTNFDDLSNLAEYWKGQIADLHPVLGTIVWVGLIDLGKALGLSPVWQAALKLIVQAAFFWSSIVVISSWLSYRWLAYVALTILAICPASLVYLGHISIDSEIAIALIVAVAWMGTAVRRKSRLLTGLALLPLFYGLAIRSNGAAAVLPLCFFWCAVAFDVFGIDLQTRRRKVAAALLSVVVFVGLIAATAAVSRAVVVVRCCLGQQAFMTPTYDLLGVSVRVQKNLVPPELYQQPNYDLAMIQKHFDPKMLDWDGLRMLTPGDYGIIMRAWTNAILQYPGAFIAHRLEVMKNFLGLHSGPTPAPYMVRFYVGSRSIVLPERAREIVDSYENQSPQFFQVRAWSEWYFGLTRGWAVYKIWIYYVAIAAILLFPIAKRRFLLDPVIWLSTSAVLYTLPYLLLANSAQFRYLYWPALALFCAFVLRLDAILSYWRARSAVNAPAAAVAP